MRELDIFVVRFIPFLLFMIFVSNVMCCWFEVEDVELGYELHGNSALYASGFFLVSLTRKRYHCVWNRAMYVFLILVPCFNFLDALLDIVPDIKTYCITLWLSAMLTATITAYLAIRHFVVITKRRHAYERATYPTTVDDSTLRH